MKKLLFSFAWLVGLQATAQSFDSYVLKVETGKTYTPLTTATNLSSGLIWDEENFKFPIGFTSDVGGSTITDFAFSTGWGFAVGTDTIGVVNTICAISGIDLADRGLVSGVPSSPLRYQITGTAPNRIFKFEMFNAGFYNEYDSYGTMNDSVNLQVWLYETTNVVEVHYGASSITHPSGLLFELGASPLVGYGKALDLDNLVMDQLYILQGNPSAPTVDSISSITSTITVMDSFPANGTVYRFIPKAVATSVTSQVLQQAVNVYPTVCTNDLNVDLKLNHEAFQAVIYAVNGQEIKRISLKEQNNKIDVSSLSTGTYVLTISGAAEKAVYKFVKQ